MSNRYTDGNPYLGAPRPAPRGRVRRQDGWEIEQQPGGKCDLRLDRRVVQYDCDDVEEALRIIRRKDPGVEEATFIDPTGYRSRIFIALR